MAAAVVAAAAPAATDHAGKPFFSPPASLAAFKASLDARTKLHANNGLLSNLPPNLSPSLLAELAGVASAAGQTAAAPNTTAAATAALNGGFQVPANGGGGGGGMRMDEAILALQPLVRFGMQQQQQQAQQQQPPPAQTQAAAQAAQVQAQALLPALLQQYANLPSFARNFRQQDGTAAAAGLHGARLDYTAARGALGSSAAAALQQAVLRDIARATGAAAFGTPAGVAGAVGASAGLTLSPRRGERGGSSGGTGGAGRAGMKRSAGALGSGLDLDGLGGDAARSVRPRTVAERKRRNNISHRLEQLKAAIPLCNPRITTETLLCETLTYIDALKAKIRNLQAEKANLLEHVLTL
ncbi:unnamed protein product [Closterium sp. Naga37s-1]|nr:unnamed protein product [Closterium sp. Naga37s-1]